MRAKGDVALDKRGDDRTPMVWAGATPATGGAMSAGAGRRTCRRWRTVVGLNITSLEAGGRSLDTLTVGSEVNESTGDGVGEARSSITGELAAERSGIADAKPVVSSGDGA